MPKNVMLPDGTPTKIPSTAELYRELRALGRARTLLLAELSGVPFSTLYRRRAGREIHLGTAIKVLQWLAAVKKANIPERNVMEWKKEKSVIVKEVADQLRAAA